MRRGVLLVGGAGGTFEALPMARWGSSVLPLQCGDCSRAGAPGQLSLWLWWCGLRWQC
jgi:hypothetical protein